MAGGWLPYLASELAGGWECEGIGRGNEKAVIPLGLARPASEDHPITKPGTQPVVRRLMGCARSRA